jgi:hypothetical protein
MKSVNLSTLEEFSFDESTTPLWAACYGYCQEKNLVCYLRRQDRICRRLDSDYRMSRNRYGGLWELAYPH